MLGLRNALTRYNPVYTGVVTSGLEHWYKLDEDNLEHDNLHGPIARL